MSNLVILSNLKLGYAKKKKMSTIFFVASVLRDVSDSARAKKMQQKWNLEAYNVFLMKIEWLMFFLSLSLFSLSLSHVLFSSSSQSCSKEEHKIFMHNERSKILQN